MFTLRLGRCRIPEQQPENLKVPGKVCRERCSEAANHGPLAFAENVSQT
jgi:hypothetical protein